MATFYSKTCRAAKYGLVAAVLLSAANVFADDVQQETFAQRAETRFEQARTKFQSDTNDATAAWQFARTCFDWADFAKNDKTRADIANQGIAACRPLIERGLKLAPAHYYLAMNLGQLARSESLGALKLVKQMEYEFKLASALDEHFDYAGPARNLGLLYREAPIWPISIGSGRQARNWLEHAAALEPDYPENILNLAESELEWRKRDAATEYLKTLDALWPKAKEHFTGEAWERSWADWSARRDLVRQKLNEPSPRTTSPKGTP